MYFSLFFCFVTGLSASAQAQTGASQICHDLKSEYRKTRFLDVHQRHVVCAAKCNFVNIDCGAAKPTPDIPFIKDVLMYIKTVKETIARGQQPQLPDATWFTIGGNSATLVAIGWFILPYISVLLLFMLHRSYNSRHPATVTLLSAVYALVILVAYYGDWWVIGFCLLHAFFVGMTPTSTGSISDTVGSYMTTLLIAFIALNSLNAIFQLSLGLCVVLWHVSVIGRIVRSRKDDIRMSLAFAFGQLVFTLRFIHFLIRTYATTNLAVAVLKVGFDSVLGTGDRVGFFSNAVADASAVLDNLHQFSTDTQIAGWFIAFWAYIIMFLLFRACLGAMVLSTIRFRFEPYVLMVGLYAYAVDITGPFTSVISSISDERSLRTRKQLYCIVMIILLIFEAVYGPEIFVMRLLIFALDAAIFRSGLIDANRFLDYQVDLGGMAFPKDGAFPFFSLDEIMKVRESVHTIHCTVKDAVGGYVTTRAVCFIRGDARGMNQLLTARHVLENATHYTVDGVENVCGAFEKHGSGVDPVVALPTASAGADVSFLTDTEISHVSYLFMVTPNGPCAPITDFNFRPNGDLTAAVNVMQGDSGSPVLAVLDDGSVRYAGCISRGSFDAGTGNYVSSVINERPADGSPGHHYMYTNVSNHVVPSTLQEINRLMHANSDAFDTMLDQWREDHKPADYDDEDAFKRAKRDRVKSWRKAGAYRKRAHAFAQTIRLSGLSEADAEELTLAFSKGEIIDFNIVRGAMQTSLFEKAKRS